MCKVTTTKKLTYINSIILIYKKATKNSEMKKSTTSTIRKPIPGTSPFLKYPCFGDEYRYVSMTKNFRNLEDEKR